MRSARRAVVAVLLTAAGCGAAQSWSGAPPWVVCDHVLDDGPSGETVWDASEGRTPPTITAVSARGIGLQVAHGCDRGATLTVEPAGAARVVDSASTADHRVAAAVVDPVASVFDVVVRHADGSVTTVHVDLGPDVTHPAG